MYKNNFDCSSTGLNIEVSARYDSDLSRIIYEENYRTCYSKTNRGVDLCIRVYDFAADNQLSTVADVGYFKNVGSHGPMTKETMVEILNEYREYCYDVESFTAQELKDELKCIDIRYVPDLLHYYGSYYHLNDDVVLYVSRGYCQGDIANVLCAGDTKECREQINHELWDCPVSATIIICGCEYNYYDFGCDQYNWEKEKFIDKVVEAHTNDKELQERLRKQLDAMLPDELEVV